VQANLMLIYWIWGQILTKTAFILCGGLN